MVVKGIKERITRYVVRTNNALRTLKPPPPLPRSGFRPLDEIKQRAASTRTDINDHLVTLFVEAVALDPKLIVELGVRTGESTFVFERVAGVSGARLVSCDIEDCSDVFAGRDAIFVQSDDVEFGQRFPEWCRDNGIEPPIDVLYIDTSHLYDHTVAEINAWFPHLSSRCKVFFHDTNMGEVYHRRDGTLGMAWDNERGVIRAIEDYLGVRLDETQDFDDYHAGWLIKHHAICNGMTVFERSPFSETVSE